MSTWSITKIKVLDWKNDKEKPIYHVDWQVASPTGSYVYGSLDLFYANMQPETEFSAITQDQMIAWVKGALGVEAVDKIDAALAAQDAHKETPVADTPLPWETK
jgi:hypothetical protein